MTAFLDLFSGIGGFSLGAYWAGLRFDAHYFSEVDPYAVRIYQQRFPDAIPCGDIRQIRADSLPPAEWIIAGGFPCQDISVAGKGAGLAGARSGLWYEYARLISELRPRYAIMENVGALAFRGLDAVLGSLAALGYDAEWQDIRASDVGAPHRRERIWIVAYPMRDGWKHGERAEGRPNRADSRMEGSSIADPQRDGVRLEPGRAKLAGLERESSAIYGGSPLAYSPDSGNARWDGELEPTEGQVRGPGRSPEDRRREWWAAQSGLGRGSSRLSAWMDGSWEDGIPRVTQGTTDRTNRLKCLGNSIVPQIAELIFAQEAFDEWRSV